jgi:hypothetical protein
VQLVCLLLAAFDFKVVENMSLACWELKLWETESSYEIYMLLRGQIQGIIWRCSYDIPNCGKKIFLKKKIELKFQRLN